MLPHAGSTDTRVHLTTRLSVWLTSVSVCFRHVIFLWLSAWVTLLSELLPNSSVTPVDRVLLLLLCSWLLCNSHYTCVCVSVHQKVFCREGRLLWQHFIIYTQSHPFLDVIYEWGIGTVLSPLPELKATFAFHLAALLQACSLVDGFPQWNVFMDLHVQFMSSMCSGFVVHVHKCLFCRWVLMSSLKDKCNGGLIT